VTGAHVVVEHVSKSYLPAVRAVCDVSLHLNPGELVALVGPSGCGKSTLLNLLGGLDRPDAGRILLDGAPLEEGDPSRYRRDTVGFVFQTHNLLPMLTARANVELPLVAAGSKRGERRARALRLLGEMGLGERAEHRPAQLSGGERQRVAVARALANQPRLLLADEPTGSLDSETSEQVLDLLAAVRERHGTTLLVVSHDEAPARRADRVLAMADGRITGGDGGAPATGGHARASPTAGRRRVTRQAG
jgi:ABC-type lipoprotein export system ATPase subunit